MASEAKLDLSFSQASIGYALSEAGDIAGSLEQYGRALKLRQEVAASDVNDARAQETVNRAHLAIGQVLRRASRRGEALEQFRQALDIAARLYARNLHDTSIAPSVSPISMARSPALRPNWRQRPGVRRRRTPIATMRSAGRRRVWRRGRRSLRRAPS